MRKRRGPFTNPRQGNILKQIENCFTAHNTDTLDASVLMNWAYGPKVIRNKCMRSRTGKRQKWPYETLKRALLKVAYWPIAEGVRQTDAMEARSRKGSAEGLEQAGEAV